ncbi:MAG: D-alanine--D-alanine ligase, partial [Candidatus Latescibacteria bacterium]|nr:D-alanine--D-alanine ligase [Candidatus Latescibacterota bacterium]
MMKIAVFMGGSSPEREVALSSGRAVAEALSERGHEVTVYDVEWERGNTLFAAVEICLANRTDVVYLALHGGLGENGGVQGVLEAAGLPYTGSGVTASAVAMDKNITKQIFVQNDIPTAPWVVVERDDDTLPDIAERIGFPCIVKPVDQGSTIGLTVAGDGDGLAGAFDEAFVYSSKVMVESYIPGSELTVPVLGDTPLPVIEIRPSHEIYDYECKYTPGMTDYLVPAPIDEKLTAELQSTARRVFRLLGLRDIARIDFRLDAGGIPLCFEANTLPGMTGTSLVPKSARAAGIGFPDLVSRIAGMALRR